MKLDIGSGRAKLAGYMTVDAEPKVGADIVWELGTDPWYMLVQSGETCEEIRAHHILEHTDPTKKVFVMKTLYDALMPGGILDIEVPRFPYPASVQDPTHISFWSRESFWYFTKDNNFGEAFAKRHPDVPLFEFVSEENDVDWKYRIVLRKPL